MNDQRIVMRKGLTIDYFMTKPRKKTVSFMEGGI